MSVFALPVYAQLQSVGEGEGQVNIVAWAGYIERGETDKNFDWVTDFEAKTGCKVNIKTAATSDEMVALMNEGGFDLVTASGDASLRLIAGKTVQPINVSLIPSWGTVDPRLQDAPWHAVDGVHYGVPYQWGSNVLMYNTEDLQGGPRRAGTSSSRRWTFPTASPIKAAFQAFRRADLHRRRRALSQAHKPELGIKDPYELNEDQYKAALELLRAQRQIVSRYRHDAFVQMDDFKNEGFVASSSWPFQVNLLAGEAAHRQHRAERGRDGVGRHHHDARRRGQPELRLSVARAFGPRAPGRPRGVVRLGAGGARRLPGQSLLTDAGCATNGEGDFDRGRLLEDTGLQVRVEPGDGLRALYRWVSDYIAILGGR